MRKVIDWKAKAERAKEMTDQGLAYAYADCLSTARLWDRYPDHDPDGNGGYYHDECSVYATEMKKRGIPC